MTATGTSPESYSPESYSPEPRSPEPRSPEPPGPDDSSRGSGRRKGRRITGPDRESLAEDLVARYRDGESIRALARATGRSYGFIHRLLSESGAPLRERGGAWRRKPA